MAMNEILHKALMAGIGVPEKLKEIADELVQKGELSESQAARLIRELSDKAGKTGEDLSRTVSEIIKKTLDKMNIPTRDEIDSVNRKLKSISSRIKKLEESMKIED
jgi:polyhydroxyalkanoate synthesis regulator phasin